ncbi:pyrroline-5-carboxylate reductase [archaeon]|jgi:pyrroline-5-carboxylate reductase|nr:pyrroline-5-carboxylate reductase [archaeon]MBT3730937.1 pyrroline-5-carboxylate reductase [archaeon]MBT4669824.1 pyrroline-5-carboxylate reductase [archaeon]MBT5029975.1 pyrroline-5-carboxylate reductase [archaeon]MBT7053360.1 pyrroline-5-carboxylate reductase [archaeon]
MKIGFIGSGNMAKALMKGILDKGISSNEEIISSDIFPEALEFVKKEYSIKTTEDNKEVVRNSEIIFLAVKPQIMNEVLEGIKEEINEQLIVSIAAGVTLKQIEKVLEGKKIIRVMPNTPCLVGEMAAGFSVNEFVNEEELKKIETVLRCSGVAYNLEEKDLDAVTGLSGSGPAFVARLIEAFTEAGIENGLDKDVAYSLSLKTFLGTAKLLEEKGLEAGKLVEMVSSPNGTTVAGREILESSDYKEIIKKTINRAKERSIELGE